MENKKGLVDRILKQAKDDQSAGGKIHRKKITLNDLQIVIEEYVQKTAGMGDPELRGRLVQMELQATTLREKIAALQKSLQSTREGWEAARKDLEAFAGERSSLKGETLQDLQKARSEAREAREEAARLKGRLAAVEMDLTEKAQKLGALKQKTETFASRLDESRRTEKRLAAENLEIKAQMAVMKENHAREVDRLQERIETFASGFDHMELLPDVDWQGLAERATSAADKADALSVNAAPPARNVLEALAEKAQRLRLDCEAAAETVDAGLDAMEKGNAAYDTIMRLCETQRRAGACEAELAFLEGMRSIFDPESNGREP